MQEENRRSRLDPKSIIAIPTAAGTGATNSLWAMAGALPEKTKVTELFSSIAAAWRLKSLGILIAVGLNGASNFSINFLINAFFTRLSLEKIPIVLQSIELHLMSSNPKKVLKQLLFLGLPTGLAVASSAVTGYQSAYPIKDYLIWAVPLGILSGIGIIITRFPGSLSMIEKAIRVSNGDELLQSRFFRLLLRRIKFLGDHAMTVEIPNSNFKYALNTFVKNYVAKSNTILNEIWQIMNNEHDYTLYKIIEEPHTYVYQHNEENMNNLLIVFKSDDSIEIKKFDRSVHCKVRNKNFYPGVRFVLSLFLSIIALVFILPVYINFSSQLLRDSNSWYYLLIVGFLFAMPSTLFYMWQFFEMPYRIETFFKYDMGDRNINVFLLSAIYFIFTLLNLFSASSVQRFGTEMIIKTKGLNVFKWLGLDKDINLFSIFNTEITGWGFFYRMLGFFVNGASASKYMNANSPVMKTNKIDRHTAKRLLSDNSIHVDFSEEATSRIASDGRYELRSNAQKAIETLDTSIQALLTIKNRHLEERAMADIGLEYGYQRGREPNF